MNFNPEMMSEPQTSRHRDARGLNPKDAWDQTNDGTYFGEILRIRDILGTMMIAQIVLTGLTLLTGVLGYIKITDKIRQDKAVAAALERIADVADSK